MSITLAPELDHAMREAASKRQETISAWVAGTACARAGTSDVVDAIVVMTALATGSVVVTSDPDDMEKLAAAFGRKLETLVV